MGRQMEWGGGMRQMGLSQNKPCSHNNKTVNTIRENHENTRRIVKILRA